MRPSYGFLLLAARPADDDDGGRHVAGRPPSRSKRAIATRGGLEAPTARPAGDAADTVNAGSPVNPGIGHGEIVHAHYGSGVSFRDPDGIALEVFAPPA